MIIYHERRVVGSKRRLVVEATGGETEKIIEEEIAV
jgi:hypothetical protein